MWSKEEEEGCWPNQLWEIEGDVLIPWMDTMGRKIIWYEVVSKVIEWSDGRVIVQVRPGDLFFRVKGRVCVYRNESSQESCNDRSGERERSAAALVRYQR